MRSYDLAKSIFLRAVELPDGEREAFVQFECAGDDSLRRDVDSLLAHHDETLLELEAALAEPLPESLGAYQIERELGRGGMGVVYLGRRNGGALVAIKALRPGLLSPALLARFRREAQILARLDHPGIARLIETGVDEGPAGPRPWLAMEHIDGTNLRAWAAQPRSMEARLELLAAVADAVEHAHQHGVVHRDLKPENVLVRPDGRAVVLDFGVARLADSDLRVTSVLTQVGMLVGTIRYMSPEQAEARADAIGPASDVYSLGVLAYELLTGRLPYEMPEDSVHRALVAVLTAAPRPMHELPAHRRATVERVLRAALAKSPAQRIASAGALADDLRRLAAGRAPLARAPRDRGVFAPAPWRVILALASGATLVGIALSTWRTPPTPGDWAQGLLRPTRMYRRVMACLDSAAVRLHYTTRTLAREREALAWTARARVLVRTLGTQPYAARIERLALFRAGEAEYLIAERTNDVRGYESASKLWVMSREPNRPAHAISLPDTSGLSAGYLIQLPPNTLTAASMALADAARLARPAEYERRALELALEADRACAAEAASADAHDVALAAALRRERQYISARIGTCLVGLGYHADSADTLSRGVERLREAPRTASEIADDPAMASHLHELGAGELRLASITRSAPLLDSAFVHLQSAYEIRSTLEGYTSRFLSRFELAQAHRLAARFEHEPGAAMRHLRAAAALLELQDGERVQLGRTDAALYDLVGLALDIDFAGVVRDTANLAGIDRRLVRRQRAFGAPRQPLLLLEAVYQRIRLQLLRNALEHDERSRRRLHQLVDQARIVMVDVRSPRWEARVRSAASPLVGAPLPKRFDELSLDPY